MARCNQNLEPTSTPSLRAGKKSGALDPPNWISYFVFDWGKNDDATSGAAGPRDERGGETKSKYTWARDGADRAANLQPALGAVRGQTSRFDLSHIFHKDTRRRKTPQSNFCSAALFDLLLLNNNFPSGGNGLSAWHNLSSLKISRPLFQLLGPCGLRPRLGQFLLLAWPGIIPQERWLACVTEEKSGGANAVAADLAKLEVSRRTLHQFYPFLALWSLKSVKKFIERLYTKQHI